MKRYTCKDIKKSPILHLFIKCKNVQLHGDKTFKKITKSNSNSKQNTDDFYDDFYDDIDYESFRNS